MASRAPVCPPLSPSCALCRRARAGAATLRGLRRSARAPWEVPPRTGDGAGLTRPGWVRVAVT